MIDRVMWNKWLVMLSLTITLGLLQVVSGCAISQKPKEVDQAPPQEQPFDTELAPEQYTAAIQRMIKISESQPHTPVGKKAHLYLARMYWSHGNPSRDYRLALKHLETYALFEPEAFQNPDIRNWQAVLSEVVRLSDSRYLSLRQIEMLNASLAQNQRNCKRLNENLGSCKADNMRLVKKNHELKQAIQDMQRLDLKHEKNRKSYR